MSSLIPRLCAVLLFSAAAPSRAEGPVFLYQEPHMGCLYSIKLICADESHAKLAKEAVFKRIGELDAIMSDYKPDSELNRLCATAGKGEAVAVSQPLFDVLQTSERISKWSDGAYDITIGPCTKLWRETKKSRKLPDAATLEKALSLVGWKNVQLDPANRTVRLLKEGMQLDLGGIAKGYALDEAARILTTEHKITTFLLDAGGQVAAFGAPLGLPGWVVGVASPSGQFGPPADVLRLSGNWHLDTSGDAQQRVEIEGKSYSHILDPKTGLGLTASTQASILSKNGAEADAIATALCILGPKKGIKLVASLADTHALILQLRPDETISRVESPDWATFRKKTTPKKGE